MSNDYYKNLLKEINCLIDNKEYQQANKVIEEELSMPYVPMDILDKLNEYQDEIRGYLETEIHIKIVEPDQLLSFLKKDQQSANLALCTLQKSNIRNYLDEIQSAFDDMDIKRVMKSILLELLVNQQVDQLFKIENIEVNPKYLKPVLQQQYVDAVYYKLENFIIDNPSFLQQCQFVLINSAYDKYPFEVNNDQIDNIAYSIIRYVYRAYGDLDKWELFVKENNIDESNLEDYDI